MALICAPAPEMGLVQGLLSSVDCHVSGLTEIGYRAVSGPQSQIGLALTALMTIYVAVLGLRLMLGLAPLRIGDVTLTALKLGLVLALATNWPVYQRLVFDTLFHGPEQLAASMMGAIQPSDSVLRGNPFEALQVAYDQLQAAAAFFTRLSAPGASPLTGGAPFAALSMNLASYVMMMTTLGIVLSAKIVLALLLALGPVFVALLLFDATRGVFEGWLRAALAFALAPLLATLALAVTLTLIEPHLIALARMRLTSEPDLAAATSILMLVMISAAVSLAGLLAVGLIAAGFRLPHRARASAEVSGAIGASRVIEPLQSRAASVAAAAAAMERRDLRLIEGQSPRRMSFAPQVQPAGAPSVPLGQAYRRPAQPRRSAGAARRDA
jgi:type IV secretion system protein VirB6